MNQTQKHTHGKKLLALLLALVMMVSLLPMSAFATELDTEPAAMIQAAADAQEPASGDAAEAEGTADEPAAPADKTAEDAEDADEQPAAPTADAQPAGDAAAVPAALSDDVAVAAETGKTVVIAGSDFQHPSGDTQGADTVTAVLNQMQTAGFTTADGFLFAGDYQYGYVDYDTNLNDHLNALKDTVEGVYGNALHEVYVQGNHDQVSYTSSGNSLSAAGANDAADYGVYVIHEDDYMWASNVSYSSTTYSDMSAEGIVKKTANELESYLNEKIETKYTKPIFVVSHLPLHYSMRTKNDGDGMYANYIFNVLNEAGEAGLNIIFLFGHNHSNGWDDYLGGSCIYLAKNDKINIAQGSKDSFKEETLNFTYMNAGYVGYYENKNSGSETSLTMTVFEIGENSVKVSRYDANGKHTLKSAGVSNDYKNESGYAPKTEVKESPQTITLNTTITAPGTTTPDTTTKTININLVVGQKKSDTISGEKYESYTVGDNEIVKVDVNVTDKTTTEGGTTIAADKAASIQAENKIIIGNGNQYIKLNGNSITSTTNKDEATVWTVAVSGDGYTLQSGERYLYHSGSSILSASTSSAVWSYNGSAFYYYYNSYNSNGNRYLRYDNGWKINTSSDNAGGAYLVTTTQGGEVPASTTVSFTGQAAGTTTVTVGNVTYIVTVRERSQANNYPEYPDPGSVRVNKTGDGINFQETGVAKVQLSTTGVPMNAGVDVIVMLDTSSSMNSNKVDTGETRLAVLKSSLSEMLESFATPDSTTGEMPDIRVAIADFNAYETETQKNSPILRDSEDHLNGCTSHYTSTYDITEHIHTGSIDSDDFADAFVTSEYFDTDAKRTDIANSLSYTSGTNYDAAFYYSYQLGAAITAKNEEDGVERDLYVVFMSDGAPFQYNFFHGYSANTGDADWNNWLNGAFASAGDVTSNSNHKYFYNTEGKHWWAEAIKGDPNGEYTVIDKTRNTDENAENQYMTEVSGLGATMYSIGFGLKDDQQITVATMQNVLRNIATDSTTCFPDVQTASELSDAFTQIASRIKMAGKNAVFTDKMGDAYDLKITPIEKSDGTQLAVPTITVSSYTLYKLSEVNGTTITTEMVGTRKDPNNPTVLETVTFNNDGTEAYSNQIGNGTTNILKDNKIEANNFTYALDTKTFTWNVGNITEDELVLTYYVYLIGSMEGTRSAGDYPTNEFAALTYTNWLGNQAHKDTTSPVMAWKSATVSYAYYLVNDKGQPVVNQSTGETGSMVNAVKVTQPKVYSTLLLNSSTEINAEVAAGDVLPVGYTLYDEAAAYKITVNSGEGQGSWEITKGKDVATTYVTHYGGADQYSNELKVENEGYNYTDTIVYFAVLYKVSCIPDSVVIDFGLPVDISVLANDILGQDATLEGLAKTSPVDGEQGTEERNSAFSIYALSLTHGTAAMNGNKVRYTPTDMQMSSVDTFAYTAQAAATNDKNFYYTTVTVIPAANIYYEDSFVTFTDGTGSVATGKWTPVGTMINATQAEDRTGTTSLPAYDANNVYGYDKAYSECTTFSLGSAQKVTVDSSITTSPTASFTFTGTGFDLISLTSNTTGTILVNVTDTNGVVKNWIVDTYYGYTREQNGYTKYTWTFGDDQQWHAKKETIQRLPSGATTGGTPTKTGDVTYEVNYTWTVTESTDNALYQIPVIRGQGLDYGTYTVTITPKYSSARDWASNGSYDFYLDAVRVYDPAGKTPDGTIGDAYVADGEAYAQVIELRNLLIDAKTLYDGESDRIVFIDGVPRAGLTDYTNYGPNNEVYLAQNQAIAFKLKADSSKIASIQLGAKAPAGEATAKVTDNGTATAIETATEMYYNITHRVMWIENADSSNVIVITNTGENILSLTNLKITYKENPNATAATLVDEQVVEEAPVMLMRMLGYEAPAPVAPEVFTPERFEASWNRDTVRAGQKATLTVKTSEDVAYIEVDGQIIDTYRTRTQRTGWGANATTVTYRQFTYTITAAETADYTVTAFNADDVASESITTTLTVQAAFQGSGLVGWLESIFGRWF